MLTIETLAQGRDASARRCRCGGGLQAKPREWRWNETSSPGRTLHLRILDHSHAFWLRVHQGHDRVINSGSAGSGFQVCRPSSAVSAVTDLPPAGDRARPLHTGRLGRPGGFPSEAGARASAVQTEGLVQTVRRRDNRAGSRSWTGPHKNRTAMGLCP